MGHQFREAPARADHWRGITNDLYHRVSDVFGDLCEPAVALQTPKLRMGAWGFHETLIPNNPAKPIRIWMMVGDKDLLNPNIMARQYARLGGRQRETWPRVLAAKGYHYQLVFFAQRQVMGMGPTKQADIA